MSAAAKNDVIAVMGNVIAVTKNVENDVTAEKKVSGSLLMMEMIRLIKLDELIYDDSTSTRKKKDAVAVDVVVTNMFNL